MLTLAALALCVWRAHADFVHSFDLPSGDAGYYTTQALRFRELLLAGDVLGFLYQATQPELHPFVHPVALGLWSVIFGATQSVMRSYGAAVFLLAMLLVVLLARRVDPRHGERVGMVVVVLIALGWFHRSHLFTAMTEPTATVAWLLALLVAVRHASDDDWLRQFEVGLAIALASLVRYNLFPMLVVPLLLHRLLESREGGRPRAACLAAWVVPTLVVFLIWSLVVPEVSRAVLVFFGFGAGKAVGLGGFDPGWVLRTVALRFAGGWAAAVPLLVLFTVGLLPLVSGRGYARGSMRLNTSTGLRLLQIVVLVGLVALAVHPAKVVRNLGLLVPTLWLCALLPWAGLQAGPRWARSVVVVLLLASHGAWQLWPVQPPRGDAVPPYRGENVYPDYLAQPDIQEVFDRVEPFAMESRWLLVGGWGYSRQLFPLWALERDPAPVVLQGWEPGIVDAEPGEEIATYLLISPPHPPKKGGERDDLTAVQQALAEALVPLVAEWTTRRRWRVRIFQQRRADLDVGRLLDGPTRQEVVERELDVKR